MNIFKKIWNTRIRIRIIKTERRKIIIVPYSSMPNENIVPKDWFTLHTIEIII